MKSHLTLSVFEIVGSPFCVSSDDGQRVYDRLAAAINKNQGLVLSFNNVTALTPAFLNASIGQFYGAFSEEKIRELIKVEDMDNIDLALLKRVIENAKQYFRDKRNTDYAAIKTD